MCMADGRWFLSRREFLAAGSAAAAGALLLQRPSAAMSVRLAESVPIGADHAVIPRSSWGGDLPATGPLEVEALEDVRFLLVHHSATPNGYSRERAVQYLRSFYGYHTSSAKGWNDIAYNFLVDSYGRIFEGRTGSIQAPIRGDATGGSQGFALLCCFIGDHSKEEPTPEAVSAMAALLAWLSSEYGIDPTPGATAEFISRGSNLHARGFPVVTRTIVGHRKMSRTSCPGDAAAAIVDRRLPEIVTALVERAEPATSQTQADDPPEAGSLDPATEDGAAPAGGRDAAAAAPSVSFGEELFGKGSSADATPRTPEADDDDSAGATVSPKGSVELRPSSTVPAPVGLSSSASAGRALGDSGSNPLSTTIVDDAWTAAAGRSARDGAPFAVSGSLWTYGSATAGLAALFGVALWRHRRWQPADIGGMPVTGEPDCDSPTPTRREPGLG